MVLSLNQDVEHAACTGERYTMSVRFMYALPLAVALLMPSNTNTACAHPFCIVPDRAVVVYENILYAMEPGTKIITERLTDKEFRIAGKLPDGVRLLSLLTTSQVQGLKGRTTLETWEKDEEKWKAVYFTVNNDKRISLVRGKPEDNAKWRGKEVGRRSIPPREDYVWWTYVFENVVNSDGEDRFITVSNEKTVIKDRQGIRMMLYPLVLLNPAQRMAPTNSG
jgi:hypothetical protein